MLHDLNMITGNNRKEKEQNSKQVIFMVTDRAVLVPQERTAAKVVKCTSINEPIQL